MKGWPGYADAVRAEAAEQWAVLEQNPRLAGPWRQLFKQVQSPRHVVSELLQNADDAGATGAAVRIEDGTFVFEHNGEDFQPEHFASLCRFGYSNKRALHTIGFRGIGFKSTFSLGDEVDLWSPSLGVRFRKERFTEPIPLDSTSGDAGLTRIGVVIQDAHRLRDVRRSLEEWLESPVSLLFFRTLRHLEIQGKGMHWSSLGSGPVDGSEWMGLEDQPESRYLLVRSEEESFPEDALAEILGERLVDSSEGMSFPPCRVEVVLGAKGRLFVVLPTGVETALPFACNAPFMQDPARLKIKDPGISPTNRWLLDRVGRLAASAMLEWLHRTDLPAAERAGAYGLLPDVDREASSLEGVCAAEVELAFADEIEDSSVLLLDSGDLAPAGKGCLLPTTLLRVWEEGREAPEFDSDGRPAVSRHLSAGNRKKLENWRLAAVLDDQEIFQRMTLIRMPRPATWRALLTLWRYVQAVLSRGYWRTWTLPRRMRLVPVQGLEELRAAEEVVRLGQERPLRSERDWKFLLPYLRTLDPDWVDLLERESDRSGEGGTDKQVAAAVQLLEKMELGRPSSVNAIAGEVSKRFFDGRRQSLASCVRLAQIMAQLPAQVPDSFRFCTEDGVARPVTDTVIWDPDGALSETFPPAWRAGHVLHPDYARPRSCTGREWSAWALSEKSRLRLLPPLEVRKWSTQFLSTFERHLRDTGYTGSVGYPYKTGRHYSNQRYILQDQDFPALLVDHWERDPRGAEVWAVVVRTLLQARASEWKEAQRVRAYQTSTNGQSTEESRLDWHPAAWVRRLRDLPILPDTRGVVRRPRELLRRTEKTLPFLDVEPFIEEALDTEACAPLLGVLGVRATPPGAEAILAKLRALSGSPNPPAKELGRWYRRLDELLGLFRESDWSLVGSALRSDRLILSEGGTWESSRTVFLAEGDGPLGTPVIPAPLRSLDLWLRVGVRSEPTAEDLLDWMRTLPVGEQLPADDLRWVRASLGRYPAQTWEEVGHWLNLADEWTPVGELSWALPLGSAMNPRVVHAWVLKRTADLRPVKLEIAAHPPFTDVAPLHASIDWRLDRCERLGGGPLSVEWLSALGEQLQRIRRDAAEEEGRIRGLAVRLSGTRIQRARGLRVVPYLNGTPAGMPQSTPVVWAHETLYVDDLPVAKLARLVPEELARVFDLPDIKAVLDYSFERSPEKIIAYIEENFHLVPADEADEAVPPSRGQAAGGTPGVGESPTQADASGEPEAALESGVVAEPGLEADDRAEEGQAPDPPAQGSDQRGGSRPASAPRSRPIIEHYATAAGFRNGGEGVFRHPDGRTLVRVSGQPFPWEERSPEGDHLCSLWARELCLELEPLQIEADLWSLIRDFPDRYGLILADLEGRPRRVTGGRLKAMVEAGDVAVHPASYRLVLRNDRTP